MKLKRAQVIELVTALGIVAGVSVVIGYALAHRQLANEPATTSHATATPMPTPSPTEVPAGPAWNANHTIEIITPTANGTVTSGSLVTGKAQVFEGQFNYRLKDSNGRVLTSGSAHVTGDSSTLSPYSFRLTFSGGDGGGALEVYNLSPRDGSEVDLVSIPVTIQ